VSLRIAQVCGLAQAKGISLPASLRLADLCSYLNAEYQKMQSWKESSWQYAGRSYLHSYMLYVLSLLDQTVDVSRLAEILGRANMDPSVLAFAGMCYRNSKRPVEAAATARRLRNLLRPTARGVDITGPGDRASGYSFYNTKVEQLALTLEFFVLEYPGDQMNTRLLYSLLENKRARGFWDSTAITVRVLSAIDALIRAENPAALDLTAVASLGGNTMLTGAFKGLAAKPASASLDFKEAPLNALARDIMQPLVISRQGTGNLYYTASLSYAIPAELQSFRDEGLGVFLGIYDVDTDTELNSGALMSGKTYRARVRVSSSRDRTWLALRVPVPSGAEILDAAFTTTASYGDKPVNSAEEGGNPSWVSHQVILDNEIQYFWDSFNKGESTVSFLFRAVRRGIYPTPPVQAECMYESEIFGRGAGMLYTIE
jgi:uncharacterized protein YfaS (alpha-2-macroglobulin family)